MRGRATGWVAACTKSGGLLAQMLGIAALVPPMAVVAGAIVVPSVLALADRVVRARDARGGFARDGGAGVIGLIGVGSISCDRLPARPLSPTCGHSARRALPSLGGQMRQEAVEILSDQTNAAVVRHPGRRFPGVLVQGDTLYTLCHNADIACRSLGRGSPGFDEINEVRNALWGLLTHYKVVMAEHDLPLPFSEQVG